MKLKLVLFLLVAIAAVQARQAQDAGSFSEDTGNKYWIRPDVVYGVENGHENKLDVIYPHKATAAVPAVIYIHGGGWIFGDKAGAVLETLPYLKMGWVAVNVEYRMASASKAPGAVEDCRCALKWIVRNAKDYHIDPARLVVTGHSAGGHLSLATGMLTERDGLDNNCPLNPGEAEPRVAAVVNWYGPTGTTLLNDLIKGPNTKNYGQMWFGSLTNKEGDCTRVIAPDIRA
jgi:acetyl esterase/lipase